MKFIRCFILITFICKYNFSYCCAIPMSKVQLEYYCTTWLLFTLCVCFPVQYWTVNCQKFIRRRKDRRNQTRFLWPFGKRAISFQNSMYVTLSCYCESLSSISSELAILQFCVFFKSHQVLLFVAKKICRRCVSKNQSTIFNQCHGWRFTWHKCRQHPRFSYFKRIDR